MRLASHLVERAIQALRRGPLEAHELAELLFPERDYPDLVSKRRAGHAAARDLIQRGVAVKQHDGSYAISPQMASNGQRPPEPAGELEYEDGQVLRVRREVLGELPLPEPPPPRQPVSPPQEPQAPPFQVLMEQFKALLAQQQTPLQAPAPAPSAEQSEAEVWAEMDAWLWETHGDLLERKNALQADFEGLRHRRRPDENYRKVLELLEAEIMILWAKWDWLSEFAPQHAPEFERQMQPFMREMKDFGRRLEEDIRVFRARRRRSWSSPPPYGSSSSYGW